MTPSSDILSRFFVSRRDVVAVLAPWGKPCPVHANGSLEKLLEAHLFGTAAPAVTVRTAHDKPQTFTGRFRVGSYTTDASGLTRWVCIDLDGGPGHVNALAKPFDTAVVTLASFEDAGLPAYLERSGGGNGWHVWCFFEEPIHAGKARDVGLALVPRNALMEDGSFANAGSSRGIEVFPKQATIDGGLGNMVWLPWWNQAPGGANRFYSSDGQEIHPDIFCASIDTVERIIAPPPVAPSRPTTPATIDTLREWKARAIETFPIETVYGDWLTGRKLHGGWLQCRDPWSESGDRDPSAGVADGTGRARRGNWHSFRTNETLDVFEFLQKRGVAQDFKAAALMLSDMTGLPVPLRRGGAMPPPPGGFSPAAGDERPQVYITTEICSVVDAAQTALLEADCGIYQRAGCLVRVSGHEKTTDVMRDSGAPVISRVPDPYLRELMSRSAQWLKNKGGEWQPGIVPTWVAETLQSRASWPFPGLTAIVETPVIRHDGTVLDTPGYDAPSGILYRPLREYPSIPSSPTLKDARFAMAELLRPFGEYPWVSRCHEAALLAALLTIPARYAIDGCCPLFAVSATAAGSGKSLLVDAVSTIATGRSSPRMTMAETDDEERKRILSMCLSGDRLALIDNVERPLGSEHLNSVLTAREFRDRELGVSRTITAPANAVWFATGNNLEFRGDLGRRVIPICLDAQTENPEERTFALENLQEWVGVHQPSLLVAALTILRAFAVAGRPRSSEHRMGSFEAWDDMVRQCVIWVSGIDPNEGRAAVRENADPRRNQLADLLEAWKNAIGVDREVSIRYVVEQSERDGTLRDCLGAFDGRWRGQGMPSVHAIGNAFRRYRGRVVNGLCLSSGHKTSAGIAWRVEQLG